MKKTMLTAGMIVLMSFVLYAEQITFTDSESGKTYIADVAYINTRIMRLYGINHTVYCQTAELANGRTGEYVRESENNIIGNVFDYLYAFCENNRDAYWIDGSQLMHFVPNSSGRSWWTESVMELNFMRMSVPEFGILDNLMDISDYYFMIYDRYEIYSISERSKGLLERGLEWLFGN
jgi:hypothetical protein